MNKRHLKNNLRALKYYVYKETLVSPTEIFWAFLGSFIGIGVISFFQSKFLFDTDNVFLIGSFAASCVLVFGAIQSPLAQPRNLILGNVVSAIIGVTINKILPETIWLSAPLAVSLSIVFMQLTRSLHPPGGATALIAIIGSEKVKNLGYLYVLSPVLTGSLILLIVAYVFNNLTPERTYPTNTYFTKRLKLFLRISKNKIPKIRIKNRAFPA